MSMVPPASPDLMNVDGAPAVSIVLGEQIHRLPDRLRLRFRCGLRLRQEEGGVDSAIATLDKKACEGSVW